LKWDEGYRPDRGRVLTAEQLQKTAKYFRYSPEDENYIAARTLPGVHAKGAFFTRGSGHNKLGGYTEIPDEYQEVIDRLLRKHKASARFVPEPIIERRAGARIGVVTIGGCDLAVREAVEILAARGIEADFMRIRGFPFDETVENFIMEHDVSYIVEQNRDAQLRSLLLLETAVPKDKLRSVLVYGGFPLSARPVVEEIMNQMDDAEHGITAVADRTPHPVVHEGVEE
jgi:2-oxoglutarate ferredoxin oxidoreductase subunit alpha